jgi:hypothetical protein
VLQNMRDTVGLVKPQTVGAEKGEPEQNAAGE